MAEAESEEKPKVKKEKEGRIYKGTVMTVEELVTKGMVGVPIQSLVPMSESVKDLYGELKSTKMPRVFILERIENSSLGPRTVTLIYKTPKMTSKTITLARGQQLNVLNGTVGAALSERWAEYALANIGATLPISVGPTFGADPEIFVVDDSGVIPAFKFLPSKTKAQHPPVDQHDNEYVAQGMGRKVYWDGFQAEFEVYPGICLGYLNDSVRNGLYMLYKAAKAHNPKAKLSLQSVVNVPMEEVTGGKPEHVQFGCAPSHNVYGIKGEPLNGHETSLRFAGGHIHMGLGVKERPKHVQIVKALDAILGVACVSGFAAFDNPLRRRYYGLAGEYRTPSHGIEYRTLSNAWLCHPVVYNLVFETARQVLKMAVNDHLPKWKADEKETIECIQNCDVKMAHAILARNKALFCGIMRFGATSKSAEVVYDVFCKGIESAIADPHDIAKNWRITGEYSWQPHSQYPEREVNWTNAWPIISKGGKV
jgi:hypothetical protein